MIGDSDAVLYKLRSGPGHIPCIWRTGEPRREIFFCDGREFLKLDRESTKMRLLKFR
jgi:hypothetical protein